LTKRKGLGGNKLQSEEEVGQLRQIYSLKKKKGELKVKEGTVKEERRVGYLEEKKW